MEKEKNQTVGEKPFAFWNRVYFAVVITTIVVISALWAFSRYFS